MENREERIRKEGRNLAIASMVCGIIALLCFLSFINVVLAILAIVFGAISLRSYSKNNMAIAGIITGILSIVLLIVSWGLIFSNSNFLKLVEDEVLNQMETYEGEYGYDYDDDGNLIYYYEDDDGNRIYYYYDEDGDIEYYFDEDSDFFDDDTEYLFEENPSHDFEEYIDYNSIEML